MSHWFCNRERNHAAKVAGIESHLFVSTMRMSTLSARGQFNVSQIMAKIPRALLEPSSDPNLVDLSMAENHLIRHEVSQFVKSAIAKSFEPEVWA